MPLSLYGPKVLYKNGRSRVYPRGGRKRRLGRGFRQLARYDKYGDIKGDVAKLKQLVNAEYKYHDGSGNSSPIPWCQNANAGSTGAAYVACINQLGLGAAPGQREGASVRFTSLQTAITLTQPVAAPPCLVRIIWFLYLRPNAGVSSYIPRVSDVLDIFNTNVNPINAPRNLSNRSKYSILSDKVCKLTDVTADIPECTIKQYRRLNFHSTWQTNDTSGDFIEKNALYLMVFTNGDSITPTVASMTFMHRLRYIDN